MTIAATSKTPDQTKPSPIAENSRVELTFSWQELEPEYQKALQRLASKVKIAGFRAGKVPAHLAEQQLKPLDLYSATLSKLFPTKYQQAIAQTKTLPISDPELSIQQAEKGKDWVVIAEYATRPEINVKDYEKVVKQANKAAQAAEKHQKSEEKSHQHDEHDHSHPEDKKLSVVYRALIEHFQPRIPALLLKQETQRDLERLTRDLQRVNLTLEAYLTKRQTTFDDLSTMMAYEALGRLQLIFLLDGIAEVAQLTVSDQEAIDSMPKPANGQPAQSPSPELLALLKQAKLRDKVAQHLLAIE